MMAVSIVRVIRNEILNYVEPTTTFQTKCNALNALADIALSLIEKRAWSRDSDLMSKILGQGLLRVVGLMAVDDIKDLISSMREGLPAEMSRFLLDDYVPPYLEIEQLGQLSMEKQGEGQPVTCENTQLLAKIVFLKWKSRQWDSYWENAYSMLDETVEIFIDSSGAAPLNCNFLYKNISTAIAAAESFKYASPMRKSATTQVKTAIDDNVKRLAKRATGRACLETKTNVLMELLQVGQYIKDWKSLPA
ncbi:hypothetical protein G7Y89_g1210 [Cudoniella acicularis]|uniref:Uncharacterized protein n=1 Tax=Cudoniella acicularis TaxID=354080 RepID=A0A8H4RXJ1_9HELO|nr:hypothetical protein G7Y89_g1210 [Cudoniella acicularis]